MDKESLIKQYVIACKIFSDNTIDEKLAKKMKKTHAFWINGNLEFMPRRQVSDNHLIQIVYFLSRGKGYKAFLSNRKRIDRIFKEAYRRKILRLDLLYSLHLNALFYFGFRDRQPRYNIDFAGEYKLNKKLLHLENN